VSGPPPPGRRKTAVYKGPAPCRLVVLADITGRDRGRPTLCRPVPADWKRRRDDRSAHRNDLHQPRAATPRSVGQARFRPASADRAPAALRPVPVRYGGRRHRINGPGGPSGLLAKARTAESRRFSLLPRPGPRWRGGRIHCHRQRKPRAGKLAVAERRSAAPGRDGDPRRRPTWRAEKRPPFVLAFRQGPQLGGALGLAQTSNEAMILIAIHQRTASPQCLPARRCWADAARPRKLLTPSPPGRRGNWRQLSACWTHRPRPNATRTTTTRCMPEPRQTDPPANPWGPYRHRPAQIRAYGRRPMCVTGLGARSLRFGARQSGLFCPEPTSERPAGPDGLPRASLNDLWFRSSGRERIVRPLWLV